MPSRFVALDPFMEEAKERAKTLPSVYYKSNFQASQALPLMMRRTGIQGEPRPLL